MTWLGRLTAEQARQLGVPDVRLVISPARARPTKPKQQPLEQNAAESKPGSTTAKE